MKISPRLVALSGAAAAGLLAAGTAAAVQAAPLIGAARRALRSSCPGGIR
ncbi:hypothetical protein [Micromonospora sp. 4G55]|nr:hypothetical protein [Micromonospora sp. 4G55]